MLYLGDAGQVHQGEVDNVGGIYLQVDRLVADALRRREMYTFVNSVGTQYIPHAHTRQNGVLFRLILHPFLSMSGWVSDSDAVNNLTLLFPDTRSVSASISCLISSKSV